MRLFEHRDDLPEFVATRQSFRSDLVTVTRLLSRVNAVGSRSDAGSCHINKERP